MNLPLVTLESLALMIASGAVFSGHVYSALCKSSCDQQTRVIRLKEDAERSAKKLQQEISNIKQARVQLMERMKEESERHRRHQTERNREVRALQMRQQQQSAQMARMERQNAMRINVLQRRMEEALAAENRLEAAQRRHLENRASGFDSMALRVKNWLQSELFVVTESKKLEHHLASLIDERKAIAMEIHIVEKQLKDPDMAQTDRVEHDARLHELKRALKEHNDDIAKLQQKILDVDPERHLKDLTSNVTDIIESPVVAKSLFEMLVAENMTTYTTAAKLREQERATAEGQKEIQQLQAKLQQAREDYDMKLTNLLKEHQELEGARKCVRNKESSN
ncbi:chromosome-associated kinesin KIF4A-like [Rhipicephalus microplus]|uniref:chromosome-associated kinesin KIF4A-like n=1 Tax=Rhipicephalus microplus TaxID=6941 RepID=UPI003F6B792D